MSVVEQGKDVIDTLIPAVALLRSQYPYFMNTLYKEPTLAHFKLPSIIDCADLITSDSLFDTIGYE
ncbi:hypothetical protein BDN72DRAFT_782845 [Pluteus cervinus]|uniref:Uncharacterized protein n=1 Tax=Pluteus cervinus TaxID=181527 RepID=A0ACD2ZWP6_9AGAR|nr:hypothetical protein BDN72DRAFT_782845 [Pluteus cervinus]